MSQATDLTSPDPHNPLRSWGLWAVTLGALSLVLVLMHIGLPMSEPAPPVGTQIGEIAGDMARASWRSFFGLEPEVQVVEPQPVPFSVYLGYVGAALGVVAVVLAMISGIMRENWHYAVYGTGLGASAVFFYFFWWIAVLICGVLMLIAIIENLGSFFSFGLWD
ncbi:MAG: hypothetical protein AAFY31_14285 [Pseudomonadota bacterium]